MERKDTVLYFPFSLLCNQTCLILVTHHESTLVVVFSLSSNISSTFAFSSCSFSYAFIQSSSAISSRLSTLSSLYLASPASLANPPLRLRCCNPRENWHQSPRTWRNFPNLYCLMTLCCYFKLFLCLKVKLKEFKARTWDETQLIAKVSQKRGNWLPPLTSQVQ